MKRTLRHWVVLIVLSMLSALGCSGSPEECETAITQGSDVRVDAYDLPAVLQGETDCLKHDFILSNTTNHAIDITGIEKTCTCTQATVEKQHLLPGEQSVLHMEARLGERKGALHVYTKLLMDPGPPFLFSLKARIYEPVRFEPQNLNLGVAEPGADISRDFSVTTCSRESPPPDPVLSLEPHDFKAEITKREEETRALSDGLFLRKTRWTLRFRLPPNAGLGALDAVARYSPRASTKNEARLAVRWAVPEVYAVTPSRVFFSVTNKDLPASGAEFPVVVRRLDGKPVELASLKSSRPQIRCTGEPLGASNELRLLVTVDESEMADFLHGEVIVEMADGWHSVLRIPVAGSR